MKGVLITGAAVRIGAEMARRLSRAGWHVVLHARGSSPDAEALRAEIAAQGGQASLVTGDLGQAEHLAAIVGSAFQACAGLEALINNAAQFAYDDADSVTAERLEANFKVNAVAPILLTRLFAERLPQGRQGCVINILDNRLFAPNPDYFSYGVSKYALYGATRMLALALAPRVRVAGIAPGITLVSGAQSEQNFRRAHAMNPLRTGCTPEQIAGAAEFILSTPSYTGDVIVIDGGEQLAPLGRDVAFTDPVAP